jgi:3',5'-cyclic-AMP phosphodiesterase
MKIFNFSLVFLASFVVACKFVVSPYIAETPKLKLNAVNLDRIKELEANTGNTFKVAFISDTHNYYNELEELVKKINADGTYSFVIITGDITNLGLISEYDEARRYFNKFKYPYLVVVGNHDLISNGDKIFDHMFGNENISFQFKNVQFILFNNNNWETGGRVPNTPWVEQQLIDTTAPLKVLVAHVSPSDKDRFTAEIIQEWENLMTVQGVNYFMHGHDHNDGVGSFGAATKITVGASSKRVYYELIISTLGPGITHKKITF